MDKDQEELVNLLRQLHQVKEQKHQENQMFYADYQQIVSLIGKKLIKADKVKEALEKKIQELTIKSSN